MCEKTVRRFRIDDAETLVCANRQPSLVDLMERITEIRKVET